MAGNSIPERQEGFQKLPLGLAKEGHVGAGFPATENSAQCDDQDVMQGMPTGVSVPGILQGIHILHQRTHRPQPPHTLSIRCSHTPIIHYCNNHPAHPPKCDCPAPIPIATVIYDIPLLKKLKWHVNTDKTNILSIKLDGIRITLALRPSRNKRAQPSRTIAKSGRLSEESCDGLRWAEGAAFGSQGHGHPVRKPSLQAHGVQCGVNQGREYLAQTGTAQGVDVLISTAILHMMVAVLNAPVVSEQLEQPSGATLR